LPQLQFWPSVRQPRLPRPALVFVNWQPRL
jgi:hypothetical protein